MSKQLIFFVISKLKEIYPNAECSLIYRNPLELLIAGRLSAQCTDVRVNCVTPLLFQKFATIYDFANADVSEVEEYICPCGLYKTKARDIVNMCKVLIEKFNSNIPHTLDELISLPGIGRKTANLILAEIYNQPTIIVDTHFIRLTKRLGFHNMKDPLKIEILMKDIIPPDESVQFCHRIVQHGRLICKAINPKCDRCVLKQLCNYENSEDNVF